MNESILIQSWFPAAAAKDKAKLQPVNRLAKRLSPALPQIPLRFQGPEEAKIRARKTPIILHEMDIKAV